jgi:hypothetical protein
MNHSSSSNNRLLTIDLKELEWFIKNTNNIEQGADEWITDHAVSVLEVDYDDCIKDPKGCYTSIYDFLGVSVGSEIFDTTDRYYSTYYDEFYASLNNDSNNNGETLFQYVANPNEVLGILSQYNITVLPP